MALNLLPHCLGKIRAQAGNTPGVLCVCQTILCFCRHRGHVQPVLAQRPKVVCDISYIAHLMAAFLRLLLLLAPVHAHREGGAPYELTETVRAIHLHRPAEAGALVQVNASAKAPWSLSLGPFTFCPAGVSVAPKFEISIAVAGCSAGVGIGDVRDGISVRLAWR